jgi:hypothetical protein
MSGTNWGNGTVRVFLKIIGAGVSAPCVLHPLTVLAVVACSAHLMLASFAFNPLRAIMPHG